MTIEDPFDYVQPCEENCTPERHAYHQGQWDMAVRMGQEQGTDMVTEDSTPPQSDLEPPSSLQAHLERIVFANTECWLEHKKGKYNDAKKDGITIRNIEMVAQILQAFQEAGYQKLPSSNVHTITVYGPGVDERRVFSTGQVFLDHFKAELRHKVINKDWEKINGIMSDDVFESIEVNGMEVRDLLVVARRAAGVSDE